MKRIPNGTILLVAVQDEASRKFNGTARNLFKSMGSKVVGRLGHRYAWAFAG